MNLAILLGRELVHLLMTAATSPLCVSTGSDSRLPTALGIDLDNTTHCADITLGVNSVSIE